MSHASDDLLALTNADRSSNGLAVLTGSSELAAYAQGRAEEIMRARALSHTADLMASVPNSLSSFVGENVGRGSSLTAIQAAFMASPAHRANILRPGYSEAGVGVVWDGVEHFYVAVIFRQPPTAAAPLSLADPAPTAEPVAAPSAISTPPATARPEPAPRRRSRPPTTGRPKPAPAPRAAMSTTTTAPSPSPPPKPTPVEHPAPSEREAGPRLDWVLQATTGESAVGSDAGDGVSGARLVAASTGSAPGNGSSSLLMALSHAGVLYAATRILGEAHRRRVGRLRS